MSTARLSPATAATDIETAFGVEESGFYGYRPVPGVGILRHLKLVVNGTPPEGPPAD